MFAFHERNINEFEKRDQRAVDRDRRVGRMVHRSRGWLMPGSIPEAELRRARKDRRILASAVCVHESYSCAIGDRIEALREGRTRVWGARKATALALGIPRRIFRIRCEHRPMERCKSSTEEASLKRRLSAVLRRSYPLHATVAFGVDRKDGDQFAWIMERQSGVVSWQAVMRGNADVAARTRRVGRLNAAFFVCGEFTGSATDNNGPYFKDQLLTSPVATLADCQILVDLAPCPGQWHHRGSCKSTNGAPKATRRRFSKHGTGILIYHHHGGVLVNGRSHMKHQSTWMVFRGGQWIDNTAVLAIVP